MSYARWVCVGEDGSSNTIRYSTNSSGSVWLNSSGNISIFLGGGGTDIANGYDTNGNNIWVATGYSTDGFNMKYSYDGILWKNIAAPSGLSPYALAYGNNRWIAGAVGTTPFYYSLDFENWTIGNSVFGTSTGNSIANAISFGINSSGVPLWIAVGNDDNITSQNIMVSSDNGISWGYAISTISGPSSGKPGLSIAYGKGSNDIPLWVAGGYTDASRIFMKYSSDGYRWNNVTTNLPSSTLYRCRAIAYGIDSSGAPLWFAGVSNNILRSSNGINWVVDASGVFGSATTGEVHSISYGIGHWVAAGRTSTSISMICNSKNGTTWTQSSGSFGIHSGSYDLKLASLSSLPITPVVPCFVAGTHILTPKGYTRVESLQSGDVCLTASKRKVIIKMYSFTIQETTENTAPYRISANALGKNIPMCDICISPLHAIKDFRGEWQIPEYLARHHALVKQYGIGKPITYYHIECPNYFKDDLVAEGAIVESFRNKQGVGSISYIWDDNRKGWLRVPKGDDGTKSIEEYKKGEIPILFRTALMP